ncbi:hypothetical protein LPJ73_001298 [Coemansia sp. RSA 2703]|nr:hypothetical protein LPJ73_001298 [Coemansia sp. RSA 2703]KAJ2373072.1 hypothetical protein IW150_003797 [Coemansia sp. RSA 2607]KAJ2395949.1 hypothetical protein GGI05_001351 [Coemansia sp. RSA 2603]
MMFGNINSSGAVIDEIESGAASDIVLPNQTGRVQKVAVDIGGSLAKVVYLTSTDAALGGGGRLHFKAFETDSIDGCIAFIKQLLDGGRGQDAQGDAPVIVATGGGAHRFGTQLREQVGVEVRVEDEMQSLTAGLSFLIREVEDEVFTYAQDKPMQFVNTCGGEDMFPYMLVNIGSGVSIIKVTGEGQYERISGTSLGGGTLWGLLHELTGVRSFDEMLEMSKSGDNTRVDMMVGDIYGGDYGKIGLKATNIAATMGGVCRTALGKQHTAADVARSLLYMVSNNVGQIAYLNAQLHGIRRIYFGGYFIRGHPPTMHTLSYAIDFWSRGQMRALFLRHEGFLGATGAFFADAAPATRTPASRRRHSFTENFSVAQEQRAHVAALGALDRQPAALVALTQLVDDAACAYVPDTVDLAGDAAQRAYWVAAMERNTRGLLRMAADGSLPGGSTSDDTAQRMQAFGTLYLRHLRRLGSQPTAYGPMSVRALLGLREQCLHEVGLYDIFAEAKRRETDAALAQLPALLAETDGMAPPEARLELLVRNVLAGNMFDWGAAELRGAIAAGALDFAAARERITWPARLDNAREFAAHAVRQPYARAVVFVDNSGADVCLGVLPFARFLAAQGTCVVLAANSRPALNDVTAGELDDIVARVAEADVGVRDALAAGRLAVCGTGSSGPCLDLRKLDERLVALCADADLVVIVGMGRAIHTNYRARFTCDSLKLAVFKNQMAADAAGASIYDALCVFERASAA